MIGLMGSNEDSDLPAGAREGAAVLEQLWGFLEGTIDLLERPGAESDLDELAGLAENIQAMGAIQETEMNTVIQACTRVRRGRRSGLRG